MFEPHYFGGVALMNIEQQDFYTQAFYRWQHWSDSLFSYVGTRTLVTADLYLCRTGFFINLDHGLGSIQSG